MLKRLARSEALLVGAGQGLAAYLGLVRDSARFLSEPDDYAGLVDPHLPVILTAWHGQHLLASILPLRHHGMAGLVSRSTDGEINAAFAAAMGMRVIRGSGGRNGQREARGDDRPLHGAGGAAGSGLLRVGRRHQAENQEPEHQGQH